MALIEWKEIYETRMVALDNEYRTLVQQISYLGEALRHKRAELWEKFSRPCRITPKNIFSMRGDCCSNMIALIFLNIGKYTSGYATVS
ncbi:hypothetical protein [Malonomonas rubra]|uniref:hypothetical protein n=1 Tax=Malonomonas rubra TaxID=57040 RepID=UPI0026F299D2|nr:hypothetical protein [Malonomonas rubra]